LVAGNVGEAGGEIGKQALKRQKFFERCNAAARPVVAALSMEVSSVIGTTFPITRRRSIATVGDRNACQPDHRVGVSVIEGYETASNLIEEGPGLSG
jgi:hypothetical protein